MADAASTKVDHKSTPPPLNNAERFGSINGSSVKYVLDGNTPQALISIFQLSEAEHVTPAQSYHMARGKQWEGTCGLKYLEKRRSRECLVGLKIQYTPAARHPQLRFMRSTPDFLVTYEHKGAPPPHLMQAKFRSGSGARKPVSDLHVARCVKNFYKDCKCQCPAQYADQVFHEMFTTGYARNDISVSSEFDSDYIRVDWYPPWWEESEPVIMSFYQKYLAWFWEGLNSDPHATAPLREFLVALNAELKQSNKPEVDVSKVFSRTPVDPNDVKQMQAFSKNKKKNASDPHTN